MTIEHIKIYARDPSKPMTGINCRVELNGAVLGSCRSAEFKIDTKGLGIVKLELYASVDIEGQVETEIETVPLKQD